MQWVLSVEDTRELERRIIEGGVSAAELMRRAGGVVAMQAAELAEGGHVVVMCGTGNNGGDGWVCAASLASHGTPVTVVTPVAPEELSGELPRTMAARAVRAGVRVRVSPDADALAGLLSDADVLVDACFGTGFHGALPEPYATWVQVTDESFLGQVVSVDVPSGVSASTGMAEGPYFMADRTVTMFAAKPGLLSGVGRVASGEIVVASLAARDGVTDVEELAETVALEEGDYLDAFPAPDVMQDKYARGRVLVVAGSRRYPGAAIMAALAAARAGAGYVTLAVPEPVVAIAQSHLLTIPVVGLPCDVEGSFGIMAAEEVGRLANHADVVLAGPGMTRSDGACEAMRAVLRSKAAVVLDADALNAVTRMCAGSALKRPNLLRREAPLVLTPHHRELARLVGRDDVASIASMHDAIEAARSLAWAVGSENFAIVEKGEVTAVTGVDRTAIVAPGPEALATAGTGDVLAGVCAGFLAQMQAQAGADGIGASDLVMLMAGADRVHAVAGELACVARGSRGIIASDLIDRVGLAYDELMRRANESYEVADDDDASSDEEVEPVDVTGPIVGLASVRDADGEDDGDDADDADNARGARGDGPADVTTVIAEQPLVSSDTQAKPEAEPYVENDTEAEDETSGGVAAPDDESAEPPADASADDSLDVPMDAEYEVLDAGVGHDGRSGRAGRPDARTAHGLAVGPGDAAQDEAHARRETEMSEEDILAAERSARDAALASMVDNRTGTMPEPAGETTILPAISLDDQNPIEANPSGLSALGKVSQAARSALHRGKSFATAAATAARTSVPAASGARGEEGREVAKTKPQSEDKTKQAPMGNPDAQNEGQGDSDRASTSTPDEASARHERHESQDAPAASRRHLKSFPGVSDGLPVRGVRATDGGHDDEAPSHPSGSPEPIVPPFLARGLTGEQEPVTNPDADGRPAQSTNGTTDTPASPGTNGGTSDASGKDPGAPDAKEGRDGSSGEDDGEKHEERELTPLERFHQLATKHTGVASTVPPDQRPSAKRRHGHHR